MSISANHRSSFARSLSSIHLKACVVSSDDSDDRDGSSSLLMSNHRGNVIRSSRIIPCNRPSNMASSANTSRAVTPPLTGVLGLPALPLSNDLNRPVKKLLRRSHSKNMGRQSPSFLPMASVDKQSGAKEKGFYNAYELGETIRSTADMIIEPTSEQAVQAVNSLQQYDFAFVERSDGTYSYAILGFRSEESLTFVVCTGGSMKIISKKRWNKSVRLVSREGTRSYSNASNPCSKVPSSGLSKKTRSVPRYISFVSRGGETIDC